MSAEKAEMRAGVVHEIGVRFDDVLEGSTAAAHRAEGAEQALQQAAGVVQQLHSLVDREVDAGSLDLAGATAAKLWVTRAVSVVNQLAAAAQQTVTAQRGQAQGLQFAVQLLRKLHDAELGEAARLREQGSPGEERSIKAERLAEEAAAAAPGQPQEAPAAAAPTVGANGSHRPPRRRRRAEGHAADP